MLQISATPLSGITIHKIGEVRLGQTRKDVENLIGLPDISDSISFDNLNVWRSFYHTYELRIDYNNSNMVEFIEFIYGPYPEKTELEIYGINPFETEADKLVEILSSYNSGPIVDAEAPYSYAFENISVGVWRDLIPSFVQELIEDKKTDNMYEIDKLSLDEELKKLNYFCTIGIGIKDYYKSWQST